jgi:hypothetical protein
MQVEIIEPTLVTVASMSSGDLFESGGGLYIKTMFDGEPAGVNIESGSTRLFGKHDLYRIVTKLYKVVEA